MHNIISHSVRIYICPRIISTIQVLIRELKGAQYSRRGGGGRVLSLEKGTDCGPTAAVLESGGCRNPRRLKKEGCPFIIL